MKQDLSVFTRRNRVQLCSHLAVIPRKQTIGASHQLRVSTTSFLVVSKFVLVIPLLAALLVLSVPPFALTLILAIPPLPVSP